MVWLAVAFIVSLLLAIVWIYFFWKIDKYEKEPIKPIVITFFLGILSVIPAIIIESLFANLLGIDKSINFNTFIYFVFVVGFTEEIAKFLPVRFYAFKKGAFNEPFDGIVYASASAIGFLFIENVMYIFPSFSSGIENGLGMITARIISSPLHILFASYWGLELGLYKKNPKRKPYVYKSLIIASLLHGLYDFLVISGLVIFALIIVIVLIKLFIKRIKFALRISPFSNANYLVECVYCQNKIKPNSLYCTNCGKPTEWIDDVKPYNLKYFCSICGNRVLYGDRRCKNCGTEINF